VYCQNYHVAHGAHGKAITVDRLAEIMLELQEEGALNINCVTPTQYLPHIKAALGKARVAGVHLPVLWNTSGYETVEAIHAHEGVVDAYLTDFKYADDALAQKYSHAANYPKVALAALEAMVEQVGEPRFDIYHGEERLVAGVVVRHLLLPGALENSKAVVRLVHERYGNSVKLSLMNQYTPVVAQEAHEGNARAQKVLQRMPELDRRVSEGDYEELLDFADSLGVEDYFWQTGGACEESFIPSFRYEGVEARCYESVH
jgi:putative pyruvate formate lyase activating enzyme